MRVPGDAARGQLPCDGLGPTAPAGSGACSFLQEGRGLNASIANGPRQKQQRGAACCSAGGLEGGFFINIAAKLPDGDAHLLHGVTVPHGDAACRQGWCCH